METINIQISLPVDLYDNISKIANNNQINELILDAINSRIHSESKKLNDLLKAGYLSSNFEDKEIIADFAVSDIENWD